MAVDLVQFEVLLESQAVSFAATCFSAGRVLLTIGSAVGYL